MIVMAPGGYMQALLVRAKPSQASWFLSFHLNPAQIKNEAKF